MDVHRLRNLTFLMSLGGLSAACFNDEGPHEDGAGPGGSTDATGTTTGGLDGTKTTSGDAASTTTTTTTTGTDDTSTSEPATSASTSEPATTTTTDGATTDDATTGPGPYDQVCLQYGALYVECYPRYANAVEGIIATCMQAIENGHEIDGPMCGQAFEEFYACLTSLECRQIGQELDQPMHCKVESDLILVFCPITGDNF
jgi:hypothetical protein